MVRIGEILVGAGVISPEQLRQALKYQDANPDVLLGSALMLLKMATAQQIEDALKKHYLLNLPEGQRLKNEDVVELVAHMTERSEEIAASTDLLAQRLYNLVKSGKS